MGETALSPYVYDALAGARASWLVTPRSTNKGMPPEQGFEQARRAYIACVTSAATVTASTTIADASKAVADAERRVQQAAVDGFVKRKAVFYERSMIAGLGLDNADLPSAPGLMGSALDMAARTLVQGSTGTEGAPQHIARRVLSEVVRTQSGHIDPRALNDSTFLQETLTTVISDLPLDKSKHSNVAMLLRTAAEDEIRKQVALYAAQGTIRALERFLGSSKDGATGTYNTSLENVLGRADEINGFVVAAQKAVLEQHKAITNTIKQMEAEFGSSTGIATASFTEKLNRDLAPLSPDQREKYLKDQLARDSNSMNPAARAEVNRRAAAASIAQDFGKASAALDTVAQLLGPTNQATRYVQAAATVSQGVSQVAGLIAAGASGPVGWLTIGMSLMQTGGSLGKLFGGGGAASPEATMMKSLKALNARLDAIEATLVRQHKETMTALRTQTFMQSFLLEWAGEALLKEYQGCIAFNRVLNERDFVDAQSVVSYLNQSSTADSNSLYLDMGRCWTTLEGTGVTFSTFDSSTKRIGSAFLLSTETVLQSKTPKYTRGTDVHVSAGQVSLAELEIERINKQHRASVLLVKAAAAHAGTTPAALFSLQQYPTSSLRDAERQLLRLTAFGGSTKGKAGESPLAALGLKTLGEQAIELQNESVGRSTSVEEMLPSPPSPSAVLTMLLVSSRLAEAPEMFKRETPDGPLSIRADAELQGLVSEQFKKARDAGNRMLVNQTPLALAARGWAVMTRGDYLVSVASELLEQEPQTAESCKTHDLCKSLAGSDAAVFNEQIWAARRLVRERPEFRDTVALWRVRKALGGTAGEFADGTRSATAYEAAYRFEHGSSLMEMLKMPTLVRVRKSTADTSPAWHMRLSGNCTGFERRKTLETNGLENCTAESCTSLKAGPADTAPATIAAWEKDIAPACVLGALPDGPRLAQGAPRADWWTQQVLNATNAHLTQTVYYLQLEQAGKKGEAAYAAEAASFIRPSGVKLWLPAASPSLKGAP